jgi:hypothetical protein
MSHTETLVLQAIGTLTFDDNPENRAARTLLGIVLSHWRFGKAHQLLERLTGNPDCVSRRVSLRSLEPSLN